MNKKEELKKKNGIKEDLEKYLMDLAKENASLIILGSALLGIIILYNYGFI